MAFEFMMKLNDMVSDPATRIARNLHEIDQQLRSIDLAAKHSSLGKMHPGIKKDIAALEFQRLKLQRSAADINDLGRISSSLATRFRHLRESTRDWLLILTPLAMGLKFVFNQAQQMAHAIVGPIRAVEQASMGLKTMFGNKIGDKLLQEMQELGPRIGRPIAELFQEATKFAVAGVPAEFIRPMVLALSDMSAMGKDIGKLQYDLAATFSRPVADLNEMRRGLTGVIDESLVWKQLAKDIGVSVGNVNFMMSKNLISGQALGVAILEVIQGLEGNKLGAKSFERADTTLGGMIDRLEARMEKLFMGLADTPGFVTLKNAMKNLIDVLGSDATQKMMNDIGNTLGKMLEPLTGKEGKKNMEAFFSSMKTIITDLLPLLEGAAKFVGYLVNNGAANLRVRQERRDALFGGGSNIGSELGGTAEDWLSPISPDTKSLPHLTPSGRTVPPLNISIPITIHSDTAGQYQDLIPDEGKAEILGKVSDAIDQINTQSGDGGIP